MRAWPARALAVLAFFLVASSAWARGGGGCFLADTPIRMADGSEKRIVDVRVGDSLATIDPASGKSLVVKVQELFPRQVDEYYKLGFESGSLLVTAEHPFYAGNGLFKTIASFAIGDSIYAIQGKSLVQRRILSMEKIVASVTVYNLKVDSPDTYIAGSILVHNKGGGGFGGGGFGRSSGGFSSRSSGSSWGGTGTSMFFFATPGVGRIGFGGYYFDSSFLVIVAIIIVVCLIVFAAKRARRRIENSGEWDTAQSIGSNDGADDEVDSLLPASSISGREERALMSASMVATNDSAYNASAMKQQARDTFLKLQECWQARDYGPMRPLMRSTLYESHLAQLRGIERRAELNIIEGLAVEGIWLVNVRYTKDPSMRSFTVLIQARAADYFVDDQTRAFKRGDREPSSFQEFWNFKQEGGKWLLNAIEQATDGRYRLSAPDLVEEVAGAAKGPAPATKLDRLLVELAKRDPIWDRAHMEERASLIFTHVFMAKEANDLREVPIAEMFPEAKESLASGLSLLRAKNRAPEYADFCVRGVDIVLARNFKDDDQDEFMATIRAQARSATRADSPEASGAEKESPLRIFEETWVFGRYDGDWALKELDPAKPIGSEFGLNIDEEGLTA